MPAEGDIPQHLRESLAEWVRRFVELVDPPGPAWPNTGLLRRLERDLALDYPFNWSDEDGYRALEDLLGRFHTDDDFALRVIDALLREDAERHDAEFLARIFEAPGSRWEVRVARHNEETHHLALRVAGAVPKAIDMLAVGPAHDHLERAWALATDVDGDRSKAYLEAVKAVEAAAKPLVTPNDPLATAGKIAGELRKNAARFEVTLRADSVEAVCDRIDVLRKSQHDRHGTDEPTDPMTQPEAVAAVHLAVELVATFSYGLIRLNGAGDLS